MIVLFCSESVPLLKETVRPVRRPDARQLSRLIADLGSRRFAVRVKAEQDLERLGDAVDPTLRAALADSPSLEVRRRLEQLRERLARWTPERLRALRASSA